MSKIQKITPFLWFDSQAAMDNLGGWLKDRFGTSTRILGAMMSSFKNALQWSLLLVFMVGSGIVLEASEARKAAYGALPKMSAQLPFVITLVC